MKDRMKKLCVIMGSSIMMLAITACGDSSITESAAVENIQMDENPSDGTEESESVAESSVADEKDNPENGEEETDEVSKDEEEDVEEESGKYMLGDTELDKILEQYDNVLSVEKFDGVIPVFGYTIPAGWERNSAEGYETDGRVEPKSRDQLHQYGDEQHSVALIEDIDINMWYNQPVVIKEKQETDYYDYNNRYKEALHQFLETGIWEEPERASKMIFNYINYTKELNKQGEVETPYGTAILYSTLKEGCYYTDYDEEKQIYTNPQNRGWYLYEGMILEIDNYYIQIEYKKADWALSGLETEIELPSELANHEYTGKLEEVIPQMFEVK